MNRSEDILMGVLKQQTTSADGLYGWTERLFKLQASARTLDVYESKESSSRMDSYSLLDVKSARVWGPGECGFDVYWKSGEAWSLLADDEEACQIWTKYFNITLKLMEAAAPSSPLRGDAVEPPLTTASTDAPDESLASNVENSFFGTSSGIVGETSVRLTSLESEYEALNEQTRREKEDALEAQQHFLRLQRQNAELTEQALSPRSSLRISSMRGPVPSSSSASFLQNSGRSMQHTSAAMQASTVQEVLEENTLLQRREMELQNAHERELETIIAKHDADLLVMKNELVQERKRYTALWQKEKAAVDTAEDNEVKLRFELTAAQELAARREQECEQLRERLQSEVQRKERALEENDAKWESRQQAQMLEYNEALLRTKKETETKIDKMQTRFDASLKEMEKTVAAAARREKDAEILRVRAAAKRDADKNVEDGRSAERRIAVEELERVKTTFMNREAVTVADVQKLQALHAERMQRYEKQIQGLRQRVAKAETGTEESNLKNLQAAERMRAQEETHADQLRLLVGRAEELETRLKAVFAELQEARAREMGFREELARNIETQRLQRAELLECRRREQAQEMEAHRWATVAREASGLQKAVRTSEQIARDEVMLLEGELRRLRSDARDRGSVPGRLAREQGGGVAGALKQPPRMAYSLAK